MMLKDKKDQRGLAVIIASGMPKKSDDGEEISYDSALSDASQSILSAIESKSSDDLTNSLKDFIHLCQDYEESDEGEDTSED